VNQHLSGREISAWLSGDRAPERQRHARECAECRAALERMEASLQQFRGAVKDWSGRELAQARPLVWPPDRRPYRFRMPRLAAAAAMVAVLAAVPAYLHHRAGARAAEIARQDEALLERVQAEVSQAVPEPMEPLTRLVSWTSDRTGATAP